MIGTREKQRLVERALWEGVKQSNDNETIIEPNWVCQTTPSAPTPFLNGVYRCEVEESEASTRIAETIAHFRRHNLPFRWKIGPSSRPSNLYSLLESHGLLHKETLFGLFADPAKITVSANKQVLIRPLTPETLDDWLKVQADAWNVPPPGIAHIRRKREEAFSDGDYTYENYIAYLGGEPLGSGALRFFADYALLMGAAVSPSHRKRGIYRSLLNYRLERIRERGLPAVIHCLENTSAPICLNLGFEKVCEIYSFEPDYTC